MKNKFLRPLVLLVIFIGALIAFSMATNKTNEDLTTTMSEATLPVMYFYKGDVRINELHGYTDKMDITDMRDSIIPVGEDRKLQIGLSTYGMNIDEVDYEVRTMDGVRLLADGKISDFEKNGDTLSVAVTIQNILNVNEEYNLYLIAKSGDKEINYYTRVMMEKNCNTGACLDFAQEFHYKTFQKDASNYFLNYIESATGDSTTLNYVNLNCSLKQIMWADFAGKPVSDLSISYKEINDSYNAIIIEYVMSSLNEKGQNEYYNVEEYYRLRLVNDRMYVLNFERTMNEIFRGENNFKHGNGIMLGTRNTQVEYATSETGDKVAFVQQGELWSFDTSKNELVQVFSFRGYEGIEARENYDQHDIKIVSVDEAGSIDFILYGYMNRGIHEGEVGLGVYHYDGIAHTVEEEAFIPSESSFEILQAEMGQLMYENEKGQVYLMMQGSIYCIDLDTLKVKQVISGLRDGWYAISSSNRYFAWVDGETRYSSNTIYFMDLKTGEKNQITEDETKCLRPLAFIDEDFIYGVANQTDVSVDAAGNTSYPMCAIKIINVADGSFDVLKTYEPSGGYVEGISVENYTISLRLIQNNAGQYVSSGTDTIMNREADTEMVAYVSTEYNETKETQTYIKLKSKLSEKKVKIITPKHIILKEIPIVQLDDSSTEGHYYVYAKGKVFSVTDQISDAILLANQKMGVVIDKNEQYVWMRARKNYQYAFQNIAPYEGDKDENSILQCVSAMLVWEGRGVCVKDISAQGFTPKEILENEMKGSIVFDLTGCTVQEVIFYVSCQKPVFAMTGTNSAVLITGYTADSIYYYDPDARETKMMSMDEADTLFRNAGNIFFSYMSGR